MQCSALPAKPHGPARRLPWRRAPGRRRREDAPFSANFCLHMSESAICCFGCFLRAAGPHKSSCQVESAICCFGCFLVAASPHKSSCQVGKGFTDHVQIAAIDVNFERLIEMGKCRVPLFKTLLSYRQARQQVSPLRSVNGAQMRKRRLETAARFAERRGFECVLACQRQPTDQCLPVSERTCLEEMVSDLPGALADGIGM